ncbi:MAG: RIP metalloprotease RseP [Treponema sp.]
MIKVVIGFLILGIVVFIHELGHFLAAKLCGVEVESFSIGWGPALFKKKYGSTEYRLSIIPLGGYCGMKGEYAFKEALEKKLSHIPYQEKSMFSVHPVKRIIIAFAGPFANLLLAAIALAVVSGFGTTYYTTDNRIVPVYCFEHDDESPARTAGLEIGDRILKIGTADTVTFADIQQAVALHPDEELPFLIERAGVQFSQKICTKLNKKTGAGQLGIFQYIPLEVHTVRKDSAADTAGIQAGDYILSFNGIPLEHYIALQYFFKDFNGKTIQATVRRDGTVLELPVHIVRTENGFVDLGIGWKTLKITEPGTGFLTAVKTGISRTGTLMQLTVKSLLLLFKGINVSDAVAGPVRISAMLGSVAQESMQAGASAVIVNVAEFIAVICVSLFLMNLLPIPVLDGGLILFAFLEWVYRRQIHPRVLYAVQFIGFGFIAILFVFAVWADFNYFMG